MKLLSSVALLVCAASAQTTSLHSVTSTLVAVHRELAAGEYRTARGMIERAVAEDPGSPALRDALGIVQQDMAEYGLAERTYRSALRLCGDGDTVERITILNNLATLYLENDQPERIEAVRPEIDKLPPDALEAHPSTAALLFNTMAMIQHERHNDREAADLFRRALDVWEEVEGRHGPIAATVRNNLGAMYSDSGDYVSAADLFTQAIDDLQRTSGTETRALVRPLLNLAETRWRQHHPDLAEPLARRAVRLADNTMGANHPVTIDAMLFDALLLKKLGQKREAHAIKKRVNAGLGNLPDLSWSRNTTTVEALSGSTNH